MSDYYGVDLSGVKERWAMLETFEVGTFAPHVGEVFRVGVGEDDWVETTLIEANAVGSGAAGEGYRAQFSLVFRGPRERVLVQQIYRVVHEGIGEFDLFLVPIGPDKEGMRYEAVFG